MKKASELIEQVFSSLEISQPGEKTYVSLFRNWETVAGAELAAHSSVKEIEKDTLIIVVDHPGWAQLLSVNTRKILTRIAEKYPELCINQIRMVVARNQL